MCISAANFIIDSINEHNIQGEWDVKLTSKRLQKLLFFADVLYMRRNEGQSMFEEDFCAWPSGPVIPRIYKIFARYQEGFMEPFEKGMHKALTSSMEKCISDVLDCTKNITTLKLVTDSHIKGGPWDQVVNGDENNYNKAINKNQVYSFYSESCNIPDFMNEAA